MTAEPDVRADGRAAPGGARPQGPRGPPERPDLHPRDGPVPVPGRARLRRRRCQSTAATPPSNAAYARTRRLDRADPPPEKYEAREARPGSRSRTAMRRARVGLERWPGRTRSGSRSSGSGSRRGRSPGRGGPPPRGWGGDRLVILRGPDGAIGIGIVTAWDSAADAAEFAAAAAIVAEAGVRWAVVSGRDQPVIIALGDGAPDILQALAG